MRPFKPTRFGEYTLLLPLSTGGMGEVLLARHEKTQALCALKRLRKGETENLELFDRFTAEARTLAALNHPGICRVIDFGLVGQAPFMALEYVDGKDLRKILTRAGELKRSLPLEFCAYVLCQMLDALAYAHRSTDGSGKNLGIVHRDVSPPNILVSYTGEVKMIDFGLAKSTLSTHHTHPSVMLGKFRYMSPEQASQQRVDARSDLYAAGICLYELISGKNPYDLEPGGVFQALAAPKLTPLQALVPSCPLDLLQTVIRATQAASKDRYQSAEAFCADLLRCGVAQSPKATAEAAGELLRSLFAPDLAAERRALLPVVMDESAATTTTLDTADVQEALAERARQVATQIGDRQHGAAAAQDDQVDEPVTEHAFDLSTVSTGRSWRWAYVVLGGVFLAGLFWVLFVA